MIDSDESNAAKHKLYNIFTHSQIPKLPIFKDLDKGYPKLNDEIPDPCPGCSTFPVRNTIGQLYGAFLSLLNLPEDTLPIMNHKTTPYIRK